MPVRLAPPRGLRAQLISSVLDQTLKLFGRGFLLAAFVPTLITTVVLNIVVVGRDKVSATIDRWASEGFGKATFDIITWIVAVYLAAYLVYGARTVLRSLFQGSWPRPLRFLQHLLERKAIGRFRRQAARCQRLTDRKNDMGWIDAPKKTWREQFHPSPPTGVALDEALGRTERVVGKVERDLTRRWAPLLQRRVGAALAGGRAALAASGQASAEQRERIDVLARRFTALKATPRFRTAVTRAGAWVERVRADADIRFDADYPPQEELVRATIFGNVMARLYAYSDTRYGIPLDVLWPRLNQVLPDEALRRVDDATVLIDFSVISAVGALVVAVTAAVVGVVADGAQQRALIALAAAIAAYLVLVRVTITAGRAFADEVAACVDLHRHKLLDALGDTTADRIVGERTVWHRLFLLFSRGELPP